MLNCSVTKKFCLRCAQWSLILCLNGHLGQIQFFSSKRSRNMGEPRSSMFSTSVPIEFPSKNLAFFCSFCKIITLHISGKNVGKLTAIQTSTVPHNSVQVSRTPITCFGKTKWVSLNFSIDKNSQLFISAYICQLNIQYNARHTASKNDRVGNGRQKEFHVEAKENSSHVTMQTGSWSSSNHATVARTFATVSPHCCSSIM